MSFQKAEKKKVRLKLAISGPSGSGKTYSALRLAKGMGGKTAVIDTENGSASLYADSFEFDVMEIHPPFTTAKYAAAIKAATAAKYDNLIIDSMTHQWAGEGGILDRKAQLDSKPGSNGYTNWNQMTPEHEAFKSAILQSDIHIIATVRSKQEYILETNDKGKQAPKKVGMAPVQRDALEYEFTIVFDVFMNHKCSVSKDRTGLFIEEVFQINEETGKTILDWTRSGKDSVVASSSPESNQKKPEGNANVSSSVPVHQNTTPNTPTNQAAALPANKLDPEDFVIKLGTHANKKLRDLNNEQIQELYTNVKAAVDGKQLRPAAHLQSQELLSNINAVMGS